MGLLEKLGVASLPLGLALLVYYLFVYVNWVLKPEHKETIAAHLLRLREMMNKEGILKSAERAYARISNYVWERKWRIALLSIPVSVGLNLLCFLALKHSFAWLDAESSACLFVYYDPPFFLSLVIWNIFSLYVTLCIIRHLSRDLNIGWLALSAVISSTLFLCLGVIQFEFGINLNALSQMGPAMWTNYGRSFWDFFVWEWMAFIGLVLIVSTNRFARFHPGIRAVIGLSIIYLAWGFLGNYWMHISDYYTVCESVPRAFLRYIPQANSRGFLWFNITSMLPFLLYIVILFIFLAIWISPMRFYRFIALNIDALIRDHQSTVKHSGRMIAFITFLLVLIIQ